ncbi:pyruvate kinase [Verrucomicrobium sp. GAS474]|uniref:pyruvate kinase n=1 Tax=Verrucomicrobium sp. GAS474 TaxID=1882831 RepID=UPI00087AF1A5|nr:pyruvate kinase [Verrucomicrobium sp. GAS474]SDT88352.1 pyruvate kinase [Verrucomicrobium sp. GAS474]
MTTPLLRRTKIVATIGPASRSPEIIRQLIRAGMNVARLNFSHGSYDDHAQSIAALRAISKELDTPVTLLQDLQGPKVRVGAMPEGKILLIPDALVTLIPEEDYTGQPATIPLDYPHAHEEAKPGTQILLADGLYEMVVVEVDQAKRSLLCRVVEGGTLQSRKGVNFPALKLRLPSLTEKDKEDLVFGLSQHVDWISLSFVRSAEDLRLLKAILKEHGATQSIIAKIEKPQAIENLEEILDESDGIMVARGDLGVEISPEKVPMLQKRIIESCNRRGLPVITATQMLESMINDPRPTRAETSDVANAIIDGTDAVMLSGETAAGAFPVRAVEMMHRIAVEVEAGIDFKSYPTLRRGDADALAEGANVIARSIEPHSIVVLTTSGHTARAVAAERSRTPVIAVTGNERVYHALNLFWGIKPLLELPSPGAPSDSFDDLVRDAEKALRRRSLAPSGSRILILGGVPSNTPRGANFVKIHTLP